jgi:hypothetical protein
MAITSIGGVRVSNTKDIIRPETKLCMLVWGSSGKGETNFTGGLNDMRMEFFGKPSLYIAIEAGEGGGAATLRKRDMPLVVPESLEELDKVLMALGTDTTFGGVCVDSSTEMVKKFIKDMALKMPCREKGTGQAEVRKEGVPTRSDYQVMGEMVRQRFQRLINLSSHANPQVRKHVIVTATERMTEDEGRIVFWGPDLPGAMATTATAMFQIVGTIDIKPKVLAGKRVNTRVFVTAGDGVKSLKDRFQVFPQELELVNIEDPSSTPNGWDLKKIWKDLWMPVIQANNQEEPRVGG